jgi:hydrogenase maturation factor HypF (carbamoyltransferase family)
MKQTKITTVDASLMCEFCKTRYAEVTDTTLKPQTESCYQCYIMKQIDELDESMESLRVSKTELLEALYKQIKQQEQRD